MSIIYKPKGPALEYSPLACNYYLGCEHFCRYCYASKALHKSAEQYFSDASPKKNFILRLAEEITKTKASITGQEILCCFIGDPYQPAEELELLTRATLELFRENGLSFTVLTKGGKRAERDFDLLEGYPARFGTTITSMVKTSVEYWEPNAASIQSRVHAIQAARVKGIPTWVSLEPVIEPAEALDVIREMHSVVDVWKVGKLNHYKVIEQKHDWVQFRDDVIALLDSLGADYMLKTSLTEDLVEK